MTHTTDTIIVAPATDLGWAWQSSFSTGSHSHRDPLDVLPQPWCTLADMASDRTAWLEGTIHHHDGTTSQLWQVQDIEHYFETRSHGYAVLYVDDGLVCRDCAYNAWLESGHYYQQASEAEYGDSSTGITCDRCYTEIVEPHCAECGDNDYTGPWFTSDSGETELCGHCMAVAVLRGEAWHTAKNAYKYGYDHYTTQPTYHLTANDLEILATLNGGNNA